MANQRKRSIVINNVELHVFGDKDLISDRIMEDGNFWENDIFEKWKSYFPTTGLMLDIGANIGNHTLMFHNSFPELKIWGFEMSYPSFELLKKNIAPYPQLTAFNVAVSDSTRIIYYNDTHDDNHGGLHVYPEGKYANLAIPLDSLRIDEKVSFIKIDVETHEIYAYEGMKYLLMRDKPLIWAEDWGNNLGGGSLQYLFDLGYEVIEQYSPYLGDYLLRYKG